MLGVSGPRADTVQFPHSFIALQYAQYAIDQLKEMEAKQDKQPFKPILKYLSVMLQAENTLLH